MIDPIESLDGLAAHQLNNASAKTHLLKVQIGPVQDFIAAARSTRDLWSGSYLLSFLIAAGIRKLRVHGGELVFPNPDPTKQPLLQAQECWRGTDQEQLLTPNLPNLFVATVPAAQATAIAKDVKQTIADEWEKIAAAVSRTHSALGIPPGKSDLFDRQVRQHLSIAWQLTAFTGGYGSAYAANSKHLDAVRQTRDFQAWGAGRWEIGGEKDSLTGREESLLGGTNREGKDVKQRVSQRFQHLFKHNDHVGAITLIKRTWHQVYLQDVLQLKTDSFRIRSIPAIAARTDKLDDEELPQEKTTGEKYIAAIAFDGDSIGKWVSGELLSDNNPGLKTHHQQFSAALSHFALNHVRAIVERPVNGTNDRGARIQVPLGQLIYAGGDDVVALVPGDAALKCALELREAFVAATAAIKGVQKNDDGSPKLDQNGAPVAIRPDASAGIAIAHIHAPLQDLIRAAQLAEKRAKKVVGRPAFSVTLMKRSGEISEWGSRWASGGIELYQAIAELLAKKKLSAKFPHRVCQLLTPYLNRGPIGDCDSFDAAAIIEREFLLAISRQSAHEQGKPNEEALLLLLQTYLQGLGHKPNEPQKLLEAVIGLCTTVAFAHRTAPSPESAAQQTAA